MEIKTKFGIGDKVWTIKGCKAVELEINYIVVSRDEVRYGDGQYNTNLETECFASKEELIRHISDNGNESL